MIDPSLIPRFPNEFSLNDFLRFFHPKNINCEPIYSLVGHKNLYFTANGRAALYLILKSMNLKKGAGVGVPLYSCPVVFDAIKSAGLEPIFIDTARESYHPDLTDIQQKAGEMDVLIVIHTFGDPVDMDRLKKVVNLPVIEDCAHSFMSKYKGKLTGTLSEASFFSFSKYISSGGGGMAVFNTIFEKAEEVYGEFSEDSYFGELLEHVRRSYMLLYRRPFYGVFFKLGHFLSESNGTIYRDIKKKRINKIHLYTAMIKMATIKEKIEKQRYNSKILLEELKDTNLILPTERKYVFWNYYLFPVIFSKKSERDGSEKQLRNSGVDTSKLYNQTPQKARKVYGYKNDCTNTEDLVDRILTIPNHYYLTEHEILKIANILRESLK